MKKNWPSNFFTQLKHANILKYLKYKYYLLVEKLYLSIADGVTFEYLVQRVAQCPECAKANKCQICGCDFAGMVFTKKKCPKTMQFEKEERDE